MTAILNPNVDSTTVLVSLGYHYGIDFQPYDNVYDETAYNDPLKFQWLAGGSKPAWSTIASIWADLRIQKDDVALPGDFKYSAFGNGADHDRWLKCDGRVLNRSDWGNLFHVIGTAYNTGSESGSEFRLPDLRGKVAMGVSASHALGTSGGAEGVKLDATHIPEHDHDLNDNIVKNVSSGATFGGVVSLIGQGQAAVGSAERTGKYGTASGSQANVPTLPPFQAAGHYFINYGKDFWPES